MERIGDQYDPYNDPTFWQDDEPETTPPASKITMSGGNARTTVSGHGGMTIAVQGGNIIRHDLAGNVIPDGVSGVQHPAPGVAFTEIT